MQNENEIYRVAALWHEALGLSRVKVIFRDSNKLEAKEYAYWMDREVYDAIPLGVKANVTDYRKHGKVDEAQNTDIYSNL